MDSEEERNLLPEFDKISFYDRRFSMKIFIKWLTESEAYFYFSKVSYNKKVIILHKLSCGARE